MCLWVCVSLSVIFVCLCVSLCVFVCLWVSLSAFECLWSVFPCLSLSVFVCFCVSTMILIVLHGWGKWITASDSDCVYLLCKLTSECMREEYGMYTSWQNVALLQRFWENLQRGIIELWSWFACNYKWGCVSVFSSFQSSSLRNKIFSGFNCQHSSIKFSK